MPVCAHAVVLSPPAPINRRSYRPQLGPADPVYRPELLPTDPGYRPELHQPIPVIDRSCADRPRLSTGAAPTDPGYRPELHQPTPFIDRSSADRPVYRPELLPADPGYRPELRRPTRLSTGAPPTDPFIDRSSCQPTPFIDRSSADRPVYRPELLPADPGYRPELRRPTPFIDRSCASRPRLSTGAPPADPVYRPELHQLSRDTNSCALGRHLLLRTDGARGGGSWQERHFGSGCGQAEGAERPELHRPTPVIDRSSASRPALSPPASQYRFASPVTPAQPPVPPPPPAPDGQEPPASLWLALPPPPADRCSPGSSAR